MKRAMRRMRKVLLMVACMALVAGLAIGGTIAWLQSVTNPVTNTFTVGNVTIKLDEGNVYDDEETDGKTTDENRGTFVNQATDRVMDNKYQLIPNSYYQKDPTVYVEEGSEDCYLFVEFTEEVTIYLDAEGKPIVGAEGKPVVEPVPENGTKKIIKASEYITYTSPDTTYGAWMESEGWQQADGIPSNVWYRVVDKDDEIRSWVLLDVIHTDNNNTENTDDDTDYYIQIKDIDGGDMLLGQYAELEWKAYAIQKANIDTPKDAWTNLSTSAND